MARKTKRLAVAAVVLGMGAGAMAPALANDSAAPGGLLGSGGLLHGLLGGEGGLLGQGDQGLFGPRGLTGSEGGLLPGLAGGHITPQEFSQGSQELVNGMETLVTTMAGLIAMVPSAEPVGGEDSAQDSNIAGGLLGGVLGGLLGRS